MNQFASEYDLIWLRWVYYSNCKHLFVVDSTQSNRCLTHRKIWQTSVNWLKSSFWAITTNTLHFSVYILWIELGWSFVTKHG